MATKMFDGVPAVTDLDFAIEQGEFFSLLGPSGCGKTTSLRLIAGFELPSEGRVLIDGEDVSTVPPYRRNVNTVFQSYALFPHLNVQDNIAFGLRRKKMDESEVSKEVGKTLELVRLAGFEQRNVARLSGGQQQRVALARALVNKPKVLLLDEPMAALDSQLKKNMQGELKALQQHLGITFVLVTHDQEEALTMSDRIAVLLEGRAQQVSAPRELYHHPNNRFVADFIGSANFLPVKVGQGHVGYLGATLKTDSKAADGEHLWMLRPESLALGQERTDNGPCLKAELSHSVFAGPVTRHHVRLEDGTVMVVEELNCRTESRQPGASVFLSWGAVDGQLVPAGET
jgi:spermidine/putrescine transport system ATP-binding protein